MKRVASVPPIILQLWTKEYNGTNNWWALPKEIQKHINKNNLSGHYRRIARLYEKLYIENGHTKNIIKFYQKAFNAHPLSIKNIFYRILSAFFF